MRLTLRTLLAYLDGILDANGAQDLGKKVEESEYATGLVHRIRDVMRRLRLGAPSLTDRGPGLDPNTVAEYLDNTLPSDRVTDFEKVCLDSDVHLAEVAACHQILTLVLGEPADVNSVSRQRMYQITDTASGNQDASGIPKPPPTLPSLGTTVVTTETSSLSLDLGETSGEPAGRKLRQKPTVPEYLREPHRRRSWMSIAAAALVAAGLLVVVLHTCGQFEPEAFCGKFLVRCGIIAPSPEPSTELAKVDEKVDGKIEESKIPPTTTPVVEPVKEPPEKTGEPPKPSPTEPTKDPAAAPVPPATDNAAKEPLKTAPLPPPASAPTPPSADVKTPPSPAADPDKATDKPTVKEPIVEPLGRLLSNDQVLLSNDAEGNWSRIAATQSLLPQQLLALPTYRANLALNAGVALEILGGTRLDLLGGPSPGIRIVYGRVVLRPLAKGGSQLRVAFGDHDGTITFGDADSTAAFEVYRVHSSGKNPEDEPPHFVADLFVTTGAVSWTDSVGGKVGELLSLKPSQRVHFDATASSSPIAIKETPVWIAGAEPMKPLDRRASPIIAESLASGSPARVGLLELATAQRSQKEVKRLALRCLGYIGQFRDIVAALDDPTNRLEWDDYSIDPLRSAIARDAETAAAVRTALEKQYPQQATDLYRMLCGYTNEQLSSGEDARLVNFLMDESLPVRVLAYWNLRDITGSGEVYRPEYPAARRQISVKRWKDRLAAKEIRLKTPDEKEKARGVRKPAGT